MNVTFRNKLKGKHRSQIPERRVINPDKVQVTPNLIEGV